jgi:lactate permease
MRFVNHVSKEKKVCHMVLLAISPIVLVLIGMIGFRKPAMVIAPIALIYAAILGITCFSAEPGMVVSQCGKGLVEGFKIILLLFSSFVILQMMKETGAMDQVKRILANITGDRRAQLIIVGLMLPIFLEGAAGAGSPAAIAAPFLVGLGFDPVTAAMVALLGDATPCSWGGAGLTTITGSAYLVSQGCMTTAQASAMVGRFHMFGVLIIPALIVLLVFGAKGFRGIGHYVIFSSVSTSLVMFLLSNFVGPEITSLGTGLISIALSVLFLKNIKLDTPEEYRYVPDQHTVLKYHTLQAFGPYLAMVILLPVVRYTFPWAVLTKFGYIVWVDCVVFLCAVIGAVMLKASPADFGSYLAVTVKKLLPAFITMSSLLVVSYIMQKAGMLGLVAQFLAGAAGAAYPAVAALIGSTGAFITGTGLGSNIMFAPMHLEAALNLHMNPITVFSAQNAGASIGNMICPNNVVACSTTVGLIGREGEVMRKVFPPFFVLLALYMILALLYTSVLFPA